VSVERRLEATAADAVARDTDAVGERRGRGARESSSDMHVSKAVPWLPVFVCGTPGLRLALCLIVKVTEGQRRERQREK
jgi:hypothetical protein